MIRTHKIKLNANKEQATYFAKAAGTRRFVFNWGLAEWQRQYEAGEKPSALALKKQFNAIKGEQFPWVYEVTKCAVEGAFQDLDAAFKHFFTGQNAYPRFKCKHDRQESFYLANDKFQVAGYFIRIPKLGWVNTTEALRFSGKILKAVVTQDKVGDWYVAIAVEVADHPAPPRGNSVGVDLGIARLATLSDGTVFENQKHLAQAENKLKRLQRSLSRKQRGSHRWEKARIRVAKAHRKVQRMRLDGLHKLTTHLATHYAFIGIENLNVSGMVRNRRLAKALSDAALGLFADLLISKCAVYGVAVQLVGRFFPSSQLCSRCGHHNKDLTLSERVFVCPACGLEIDRDWNAARNIEKEAWRLAGVCLKTPVQVSGYGWTLNTLVDRT